MTHNYNYDLAMLRALLQTPARYIGMLGPKKKLDRMLKDIQTSGKPLTDEQLGRLYSPVGLDIGAESAEEIALSVISEIKMVLAGKTGQSLHNKGDFIHSREDLFMEEKTLD